MKNRVKQLPINKTPATKKKDKQSEVKQLENINKDDKNLAKKLKTFKNINKYATKENTKRTNEQKHASVVQSP